MGRDAEQKSGVREHVRPGEVPVDAGDNAVAAFWAMAAEAPERPAASHRVGDRFVDFTAAELLSSIEKLAAGLVALGLEPGARVAIFSGTRIEFLQLDFAIWAAGCASVPVYESDSASQLEWILADSGAEVLICANEELRLRYAEISDRVGHMRAVFTLDEDGLDEITAVATDESAAEVERRRRRIGHDAEATIVYTSGTTAKPKGCVVTHHNIIWEARQLHAGAPPIFETPEASTLVFLPLAHVLARVVTITCVLGGMRVGFCTSLDDLRDDLILFQPTALVVVPRVLEKTLAAGEARAAHGLQAALFHRAMDVAELSTRESRGASAVLLSAERAIYDRVVYAKLRHAFGGKLRFVISGGAPLSDRLARVFTGMGVEVLEGYGLTETTAASHVNLPGAVRFGTVGPSVPGGSARISPEGEIQLKGGFIFREYLNNPEATAAAFTDDGWFRTGDLGSLDDDGYLSITGRIKDILVTAGGKNVAPSAIEERILDSPLVSHVVVVGDSRPFIAALITLDPANLQAWALRHGKGAIDGDELRSDPELRTEIQLAVDRANQSFSRAESVREFRILAGDFTVDSGELTASLKVRRNVVSDRFAAVITDIYGA